MRDARRDELGRPIRVFRYERDVNGRRVELRFALVEGRLVCIGLEAGPPVIEGDGGKHVFNVIDDAELDPLRSAEIRFRLRDLIDEALEHAATRFLSLKTPEARAQLAPLEAAAKKGRKKPGRPPVHGDDHYREVARIYEETLASGRRDPLQAIRRRFKIEKSAAAGKVREARRRGLLTTDYFKTEDS